MLDRLVSDATCDELLEYLKVQSVIGAGEMANALSAAVRRGDRGVVQLLLDHGATPDCRPAEHLPPLLCAIEQQDKEMVGLLLRRGADINFATEDGFTPLHLAVDVDSDTAYQRGSEPSNELTTLMLNNGADPTLRDNSGRSPLNIAEIYANQRAVNLLTARKGGRGAP